MSTYFSETVHLFNFGKGAPIFENFAPIPAREPIHDQIRSHAIRHTNGMPLERVEPACYRAAGRPGNAFSHAGKPLGLPGDGGRA